MVQRIKEEDALARQLGNMPMSAHSFNADLYQMLASLGLLSFGPILRDAHIVTAADGATHSAK